MLPGQLKGNICVVEGMSVGIDPIVATKAVVSISCKVWLHKIGFDLLVAGRADGLVKPGVAIYVTSIASKRRTIRLASMGCKSVPESIV